MFNTKIPRRNMKSKFLQTLYEILDNEEQQLAKWKPNGFNIFKVSEFKVTLLPQYFKHNHYTSFLRQLNKYGFQQKSQEEDQCSFTHKFICKDLRVLKKEQPIRQQAEQTFDIVGDLTKLRLSVENIQYQQRQLMKQMIISNKIMSKLVLHYQNLSNLILGTVNQAHRYTEIIQQNMTKAMRNLSGDLLLHQIAASKIAFPEFYDSTFVTPSQSLLSTPIPFYISMLQELNQIKDQLRR